MLSCGHDQASKTAWACGSPQPPPLFTPARMEQQSVPSPTVFCPEETLRRLLSHESKLQIMCFAEEASTQLELTSLIAAIVGVDPCSSAS